MASSNQTTKTALNLRQPEISQLVRELRQLMQLTQAQFAAELGVAYETINRWENGHMQPSALALKQLRFVIDGLTNSPSKSLRDGSSILLSKYFVEEQRL
ncbi:helix-turn-helix transcriptional regulator [Oscillatoria sp. FACHB-1407]|uniref:helix-turn-helix domain-containing protein n=1 Tax=Oscillatoria sp. FACHB-1407 TaxID=2692847 RepID=UPI0016822974|nr:helix-turn-helix transcriptional regulator [Oscillatoria sp. FACHB-1407]MBD2461924.1 helix-turn-helix transcriptional regulator [Oscillatoria sp. FACHB-1407]